MKSPRNLRFKDQWKPFQLEKGLLNLDNSTVNGCVHSFNPTTARYDFTNPTLYRVKFNWTPRNNRVGRHALTVTVGDKTQLSSWPESTTTFKAVCKGILRMWIKWPVSNISYQVGMIHFLGSICWVTSALFSYLPYSGHDFPGETLYCGGITAFVGSFIFVVGGYLLFLEAINADRRGCFGWSLKPYNAKHLTWTVDKCTHARHDKSGTQPWICWPTWQDVKEHYIYELGFLAASIQAISGPIFLLSAIVSLPKLHERLSHEALIALLWIPKLLASCGFTTSGILVMLETQQMWLRPAFNTTGWWIGGFKTVGGIASIFAACFGLSYETWGSEASALAAVVGACAFLVASLLRWYECLDRYPVEVKIV